MKKLLLILLIILIFIIITAGCSPQEYQVNIETSPEDSGEVVGEGAYEAGEEVELAAIPNEEYKFKNWTIDGEVIPEDKIYKITVDEDLDITANFDRIWRNKFAYLNINDGVDVRIGPFYEGEEVTLKAETIEGYVFLNWEIDGEKFSEEKKIEFNIDKRDIRVKANYKNMTKLIDELIEKADKALGEKRWSDAGEYLLEAYNPGNMEISKYKENLDDFHSYMYTNKSDLYTDLKEEKIITEQDIKPIEYEGIKPEKPNVEILERNDQEIYEWFYDYIEFYDDIRFHYFREYVSQEAKTYHLMSEDAYNKIQEVPLKYSNEPISIFLWFNKKLINNSIYALGVGGYEGLTPESAFAAGKLTRLTKEDNKLIFEFTDISDEYLRDSWVGIGKDEDYKMEFELYFKDDDTFRVGDIKLITENGTF
ncbi:MAG: hypothetical protein H0S78_12240 [Tissierellales bacterium]|nr:hypothetical protein [Tissierellales bacterium]